ncbi:serine/threonine-protein kinase [Streptomyces sp. BK239]|uniref:serine/threonine-protein kinase n=1 Tax=Streptomyces sp. BK239 TaxID=2512155 RepID=UPI00102C4B81|nr:serine/threonine-protein kinase [Streptomyces sp. BK239]RZU25298.1 serine/threonine protein kinase [Streptomyces sp. BK239]
MALHRDDPKSLGGYRIVDRLGAGGMGVVYRAVSGSGRELAVKVVHAQYAEDAVFRTRFRQEIDAVRKVSGAFTAPVVDADPEAVRPWMATQYVPAPSLAARIRDEGPLRQPELRRLALGLVEALREIHRAGVVHRDLKPGNVLMAEDGPRVIDFGISRATENQTLTETGHLMGTPPFMSPEQLTDARTVGPPSDVFSLGALLTFAATGRGPFDAYSPYLTAYRVMNEQPDLTRLPPSLRAVVAHCLAKTPDERPELDDLLKQFAAALPEGAQEALESEENHGAQEDRDAGAPRRPGPGTSPEPAVGPPLEQVAEPLAAPVAEPAGDRRGRVRLFALAGAAGVLAVALAVYLVLGPLNDRGGGRPGGSPSSTDSRWAAVPAGWKPWTTTVREPAEHGVTRAPERTGKQGTPSCAPASNAVYCVGGGVLPVRLDALSGRTAWRAGAAGSEEAPAGYEGHMLGVEDGVVLVRESEPLTPDSSPRPPVLTALDADTGKRLWSRPVSSGNGAPGLAGGLVIVPEADLRTMTARSPRDGARRWSAPLPADHACTFHGFGDALYTLCGRYDVDEPKAKLLSIDPADGKTRELAVVAPDSVLLGARDGRPVLLEPTEGSRQESGDDLAYARVVSVDPVSGERRAVAAAGEPVGQPALVGGVVCFAASNGLVTAVSPETGARLWQTRTSLEQPGRAMAGPRGATVFLASASGRVAALDARTGRVLWETLPHAARIGASGWLPEMLPLAGALVVVTSDGTVFSVDPAHPDSTPAPA